MTITLLLYNATLKLFIFDHYGLHSSLISVIMTAVSYTDALDRLRVRLNLILLFIHVTIIFIFCW